MGKKTAVAVTGVAVAAGGTVLVGGALAVGGAVVAVKVAKKVKERLHDSGGGPSGPEPRRPAPPSQRESQESAGTRMCPPPRQSNRPEQVSQPSTFREHQVSQIDFNNPYSADTLLWGDGYG